MKKTLYLMRHGQTLFNLQHKIQGWCDSPLTKLGIKQAKVAGKWFKDHDITFDHAYSSTSERCCDTLELVTDMPYVRTKGLKENYYGELEGESERLNSHLTPKDCETFYLQYKGESSNTTRDRMVKTSPVVGATKLSHIDTACKACDLKLTVEEMKYLEECYKPHPLVGVMKENNQ